MRRLLLVLLMMPAESFATLPAPLDEFGALGGYYRQFHRCPGQPARPESDECADGNGLICALVDKVDQVQGKMNQVQDLEALVSGLRKKGLWASAKRAEARLEELSPRNPKWNTISYELITVPDLLSRCKTELADAILHDAARDAEGDLGDDTRAMLAAQLAYTRARIGDLREARELVERLDQSAPARSGAATNNILRRVAMASAEIGDFDRALQILQRINDPAIKNYILQIAAYQQRFDVATQLCGTGLTTNYALHWLRALVLKEFVEHDRIEEADKWASNWGMLSSPDETSALHFPSFAKIRTLALAKKDPVAARSYLRQSDPKANPNGIAVVAALAGNPDGAKAAIDPEYLEQIGWAHTYGTLGDPAYATLVEAWTRTAQAFWKAGRDSEAIEVLDGAVAHVKAHWCPNSDWCATRLSPLSYAYAGINQPSKGLALLEDFPKAPNDFRRPTRYFLWSAAVQSLLLAGKVEEAFEVLNAEWPGNVGFEIIFVGNTYGAGEESPGPMLFAYGVGFGKERLFY